MHSFVRLARRRPYVPERPDRKVEPPRRPRTPKVSLKGLGFPPGPRMPISPELRKVVEAASLVAEGHPAERTRPTNPKQRGSTSKIRKGTHKEDADS